jgi:hypothetical protein
MSERRRGDIALSGGRPQLVFDAKDPQKLFVRTATRYLRCGASSGSLDPSQELKILGANHPWTRFVPRSSDHHRDYLPMGLRFNSYAVHSGLLRLSDPGWVVSPAHGNALQQF